MIKTRVREVLILLNAKVGFNTQLSSILITFSSSLNESSRFDSFLDEEGSVILLLAPLDTHGDMVLELSTPSEEFLGLSDIGDLIDSLRGCFASEALIDLGMHFERPEVDSSLSSIVSNCLLVLLERYATCKKEKEFTSADLRIQISASKASKL